MRAKWCVAWTDADVATLKRLHAEGLSGSEIAAAMGCFTHCKDGGRSAVCGKLHRLGLRRVNRNARRRSLKSRAPRVRDTRPIIPEHKPAPKPKPPRITPTDPCALAAEAHLNAAKDAEARRAAWRQTGWGRAR